MKQLIAIVKPFLAQAVLEGLAELQPLELIVREVKGYGRQRSYLNEYRGSEFAHVFVAKVEITAWLDDDAVEPAIEVVVHQSRTGRLGDGKILVLSSDGEQIVAC